MNTFPDPFPVPPARSNREIQRDFLDLTFQLESGSGLQYFTRFEGPISVAVTGNPSATLVADLKRLIDRLRREAGIRISLTRSASANITIEAVSRADIQRHLPKAACFVVPNISSLSEYRAARRHRITAWDSLVRREKLAIFVPNDASPQEVRDCLHEELAQAIGPLNDLYRLTDSIFNDDNIHTVLTGFDMLILRAYYAPELRSGMTRGQVVQRLPGLLSRLNPAGDSRAYRPAPKTPRAWIRAIQTALGPGTSPGQRRAKATEAVSITQSANITDHRHGFGHFALGRLTRRTDPEFAYKQFLIADQFYRQSPGTKLHRAYVASELAAYAISRRDGPKALAILKPHIATATRYENAALLSTLMLLQAEALKLTGRTDKARAVHLDSLGWARYGFGVNWTARARSRQTSTLSASN